MFEGDSADMRTRKFLLVSMGAERRVSRVPTWERRPPLVLSEIAELSPSSSSSWDELALISFFPTHPHLPPSPQPPPHTPRDSTKTSN